MVIFSRILAVVAVWFLFFRGAAPDEVSPDSGLEQLQKELAAVPGSSVPDSSIPDSNAPVDPVNGIWSVDSDFGTFDFETASGSFAGFRVDEELTLGTTVAVGRSGGVAGSLTITDGTLTDAEITVDMTTIVSDRAQREGKIRGAVGASDFPTAKFVLTKPVMLDAKALEAGDTVMIDAVGDLTVKGTTNETTFVIEATIAEPGVGLVIGSTPSVWEALGVDNPSAPVVVSIAGNGIVEFQLVLRRN